MHDADPPVDLGTHAEQAKRPEPLGIHDHNNMQKKCKELGCWAGNVKTTSLLAPALSNNGIGWEGRAILTEA